MNASEPLLRCREVATSCQKLQDGALIKCLVDIFSDEPAGALENTELRSIAITYLLAIRQASFRGHEFYLGLITELGNLIINAKGNTQ